MILIKISLLNKSSCLKKLYLNCLVDMMNNDDYDD